MNALPHIFGGSRFKTLSHNPLTKGKSPLKIVFGQIQKNWEHKFSYNVYKVNRPSKFFGQIQKKNLGKNLASFFFSDRF